MSAPEALIRAATEKLRAAGIADPARDARKLWQAACPRRYLEYGALADGTVAARYEAMIDRRITGEPVAKITGHRAFWKHDFTVTADVLDPRPETETLVEAALEAPFSTVLDLGTGSGCILLSLLAERPATGLGTDLSQAALEVAQQNRALLELETRAELIRSDWFSAVEGQFDLIVSNPPYISARAYASLPRDVRDFDPELALSPGGDGLDAYRRIIPEAPRYLSAAGRLIVEIGFDQAGAVEAMFHLAGFTQTRILRDLAGHPRVVAGTGSKSV